MIPEVKDTWWLPPGWRSHLEPPDPRGLTDAILRFHRRLYPNWKDNRYQMKGAWETANKLTGWHDQTGVWHPPEPPDKAPQSQQHIPDAVKDGSWQLM